MKPVLQKKRDSVVTIKKASGKKTHKKTKSGVINLTTHMTPLPEQSRNHDHHSTSKSLLRALETVRKSQKSDHCWSELKIENFDLGKIAAPPS